MSTSLILPPVPRLGPNDDWLQFYNLALYKWLTQVRGAILQTVVQVGSISTVPASSYPVGTLLQWTPGGSTTGSLLYINLAGSWDYLSGELFGPQSSLLAGLAASDANLPFNVTDYAHKLIWSGSTWNWAPGDGGSGLMQMFEIDPDVGWHLYDGAHGVSYLKSDGTLGTIDLPDLTGDYAFLVGGSPNSAVNAPIAPVATAGGGTIANAATGVTIPANTGAPSATATVQSGAGATVASSTHTHTEGPVTDPTHTHGFTPKQPVISATGQPQNILRRMFFRV